MERTINIYSGNYIMYSILYIIYSIEIKSFKCKACDNRNGLRQHMLKHIGEKPYNCILYQLNFKAPQVYNRVYFFIRLQIIYIIYIY